MADDNHDNHILAERRAKLAEWRANGGAYPNNFKRNALNADLHAQFDCESAEDLAQNKKHFSIAGRMLLKRVMGKAAFATLQDMSSRLQVYVSRASVGEDAYKDFKRFDLGDIVGVCGFLMKTQTGELTLHAEKICLLSKSLRPLPDKFHGLADIEQKYRQRYVDLIVNEKSRAVFLKRSEILHTLRDLMRGEGFMEVETPMMHPIPGGASAKPFVTHHNALDLPMFLRIAPELYLKRLVVGGFEKVFELNRNGRNEGLSPRHNPEFTMMEFYCAYADYEDVMNFTENLLKKLAQSVCGTLQIEYQGKMVDLSKPFERLTILQAIQKVHPEMNDLDLKNESFLKEKIRRFGEEVTPGALGALQLQLFEACAEKEMWQPTFIVDYPVEVSPLARKSDKTENITERFELFVVGRELANGFSELNDPEDQAARFEEQVKAKDAGDEEAMYFDSDYIRALEYGLAPTGGCGIGIDRLVMLLTDSPSIRDVILFPHMRPE